ncbi:DNA-binding transcriptional regulator, LysR family [Amycolatopsis tolypomycina]|uniref:DNA-binding transcriptional regulator, LysR family n=1 Tax=Amycolatopsis tolypomycina TaxID=208445 RepID=A0A1H4THP1_9PSEU|nr:LysR substrate-binding domain-containing protein [Amycolatopsis tolypomycina]SEC56006.1 DNA-binding transcriptional regulator, LysR family [Amycolatopsis tolypomycina]
MLGVDFDLRQLRYFVAVAEELHFGRAAARLHIAQPALSRRIRALEDELKTPLFVRDRRTTVLTAAGEQLLADARDLLAAAEAVHRRVTAAAGAKPVLTVGFMPGIVVTPAVRELARHRPDVGVRLLRTSWHDQVAVLHDGRVDVGIVRLPVERRGLTVRPLFTEPRVVMVPATHRLAGEESVSITELAGEHLLQDPDAVPEWRDIAVELRAPGRPEVPRIHSVEEKLELVAAGAGISVIPRSTAMFYTRPDVIGIPVPDIAPNHVALAWLTARRSPLVDAFLDAAASLVPGSITTS